ncbi:unnamed protein product [Mytilus edulis]|uniref:Endonuclease/exonuclease/phosphatase domain-containing protein n=1 Tax=Mytilus edulis TaxID=6550 RepID=A0A8S3SD65_MYTED|nr:unnamed protein product [Mytilus edulis]
MTNIQKEIVDEVTDNVSRQEERQKLQFDKKHNVVNNSFKKGDLVLVKNMKKKKTLGMIKWLGPYIISDLPKLGTITLIDSNDKLIGKYRQNNIKRYISLEPNSTMIEKSDNEELHEDDIIDENNNTENDMGDSIFITQSSYDDNNMINENTFDLGIEDLFMPSPSPTKEKDTDEKQTKTDEVNESGRVCRPKRKLKDRRNIIYEYFTVLNDTEYHAHLHTSLSGIPEGAHVWLGGDFNLGDINWEDESVKQYAAKSGPSHQLLNISKDPFLNQVVVEPTRTTDTCENILDLFFTNNSSLVNKVHVIPGISDHETVYIESSLRPIKTKLPPREVSTYKRRL